MAKVVKRDGRWVADYYDAQGKRHREYRRTKRETERLLAERLGQIQKGSFRPDGRTRRFGDFAEEWLKVKASGWSPNTHTLYSNSVNRYLLHPDIGFTRYRLSAIDLAVAERFKAALIGTYPDLAPRTVNLALTALGAILKHAVRHGYRSENPVQYLDKLPEKRREIDPLNSNEVEKLLSKAKDIDSTLHILVSMGIYTGMRLGELLALRWQDADFESGSLRVQGTNSHQKHRDLYIASGAFSDPKTERSRRTVKLSPNALQILREHRLMSGNPQGRALIFPNQEGHPIDPNNFRKRLWNRLVRETKPREGFRFHDLRHTYASQMLANGVPVEFVQRQLGHSSYQTTLSKYRHWIPDRDDVHAVTIDEILKASGH